MRSITQYGERVYKAKSSALRAARNAVGSRFVMEAPELANRFDGEILVTESMIAVEAHEGGWRWSYTFDLAEVLVRVMGMDGTPTEARYADVAQWKNATTPRIVAAPLVDTSPVAHGVVLPDIIHRIEQYRSTSKSIYSSGDIRGYFSYITSITPILEADCKAMGIDFRDVDTVLDMIAVVEESTNPLTIAEVIVDAEPFGLDSKLRPRLIELARLRGKSPEYYLKRVQGNLQRCAV